MGQAKRRGSFEQRQAEGIVKAAEEARRREEAHQYWLAQREERYRKIDEARAEINAAMQKTPGPRRNAMGRVAMLAAIGASMGAGYGTMGHVRTPHNPDKGLKGGSCNREACQKPGAYWYNEGSRRYYCAGCAELINRGAPLCKDETP